MPTYRVSYFQSRGRAEVMRQILEYSGQKYEDRRFEQKAWEKVKPSTPFGLLPLLEVDGKVICQSNACARYLAKTFGLYGSNEWEGAQIDMIVDCMEDMIKPVGPMITNKNEVEKAEQKQKLVDESLPEQLRHLEKFLTTNGRGEYFVGNKISFADIQVAHYYSFLTKANLVDAAKFPKVTAVRNRVENEPKIKAWIARRPDSEY